MGFAKRGSQYTVNTTTAADQFDSAVTQLKNGNLVAVWTDENGSAVNVYGQILSSDGLTKIGDEFRLNTTLDSWQYDVSVAALGDGGFAAAWTSLADWPSGANPPFYLSNTGVASHVVTQVFDADGDKVGGEATHFLDDSDYGAGAEFFGLDTHYQYGSALTANVNGNDGDFDLFFGEELYEYSESYILFPLVEIDVTGERNIAHFSGGDGEFLIDSARNQTWDDAHKLGIDNVMPDDYAELDQFYDTDALTLGDGTVVTAFTRSSENSGRAGVHIDISSRAGTIRVGGTDAFGPALAELANGNIVAVWTNTADSADGDEDIKAQIIAPDGTKIGGEILVADRAWHEPEDIYGGPQADVAALADGRFLVVWENVNGDGDGSSIQGQVITAGGDKSGEAFVINTTTTSDQMFPTVTGLINGDALATWTDPNGGGDVFAQVIDPQTYSGDSSAETVYGGDDVDHLDGGAGADVLHGRGGDDVFESVTYDDITDGDIFDGGAGTDTLDFDDYVLEWLAPPVLIGDNATVQSVEVINLHGSTSQPGLNNIELAIPLVNSSSTGAITVNGNAGQDFVSAERINNAAIALTINGKSGDDQLTGGDGADKLNGGTGTDVMAGGSGNDTYVVDATGDVVTEDFFQGLADRVQSSVDYTIGDNIEELDLTGNADIDGTGNGLYNKIFGNPGANVLSGLGGTDHLYGEAGDDNLYGGEQGDVLFGGSEDDKLDGGTGADHMRGGTGSDLYVVDDTGDEVVEYANEGDADIVMSSLDTVLAPNVENLWLLGTAGVFGTGNLQSNTIVGNSANNTLAGITGDDHLFGLAGNDILWGGAGADELDGSEGIDTTLYIESTAFVNVDLSAQFVFGGTAQGDTLSEVENVIGSTYDDILVGDANANILTGGDGSDTLGGAGGKDSLIGGIGADNMIGGDQDDTYFADNLGDAITEVADEGYDIVNTTLTTFTLGANVERVNSNGTLGFVGIGNELDNRFQSLGGDDRFVDIAGGADTFSGGSGTDTVDFRGSVAGVVLDFITDVHGGAAAGDIYASIEKFLGSSSAADTMTAGGTGRVVFAGYGGNDTLTGGIKNDQLLGGADNDVLSGGADRDTLDGGAGNDTLTGGSEADVFNFVDAAFGQDTITDFDDGVDSFKIYSAIANDIGDFIITGNGSTSVRLTLLADPTNFIVVNGAAPITVDAADFVFY